MSAAIKRISAGNVDGRANSPRYIQKQLTDLHNALAANAAELKAALRSDSQSPAASAEAEVELFSAVSAVKEQYAQVDFEELLKDEYRAARGEDFEERRIAAGIVYVVPSLHTLLFSVISPLSAAISTGNCVIVELENSLLETASVLRRVLTEALDKDTFTVVDSRPDGAFLRKCVVVQGREEAQDVATDSTALVSPASARVIALVDRTADFEAAAKAIVYARTAFAGKSPYAPDAILVNEFMVEQFTNAVVTQFTKYMSSSVAANGHANGRMNGSAGKPRRKEANRGLSEKELNEDSVTVVLSGASGTIVSVKNRDSPLLNKKINDPILVIHTITSLDDAIDFANTSDQPLLATYHFAAAPVAKYTSQFISSRAHFINHIPPALLIGPAAPASHATSPTARYTSSMFSVPCPLFSGPTISTQLLETALTSSTAGKVSGKVFAELAEKAAEPLKPTGQRPGKLVGFFDQGLILGASIVFTPIVAGLGVGAFYGGRAALRAGLRAWK